MSEDIIQRMGFDAGPAIASINSLKTALDGLNTTLGTTGKEIRGWNAGGKGATKMFDSMQKAAEGLLAQYNALAKAQANMVSGTGGGTPKGGIESHLNLIQKLTNAWGAMPASASASSKQAFAQGQANLAQFAAANKMTAQQVVQAFTTMGTNTKGVVGQMGQNFTALKTAHNAATAQMTKGNQELTVSFGTLVKVMQFRVVISALTSLIQKFEEGVQAGADFSRQLGMIATIAGEDMNLGKIETQLISLSREFAKPLPDVASAYYLVLQNQVGNATQSMLVLEQAMKLSVSTGTDAKDSAEALTVALNGFGLQAEQSGDVSGKLFKAMDLGRFSFDQMGDTLGRVAPIAKELNVSISEILGPIATMTRSGVSLSTAITQMRAILSQTLKPTEELKNIFKTWGVEDAQQAISKFGGVMPMLKALETATHGSSTELAAAFTNLRAYTGAVSILGKNYQNAVNDTKAIEGATKEFSDQMTKTVEETAGFKFDKVLNEIKVDFTELGKSAIPILTSLLGVVENVTNSFKGMGTAAGIGVLTGMLATVGSLIYSFGQWLITIKACQVALASLRFASVVGGALAVSYAGGLLIGKIINDLRGIPEEAEALNKQLEEVQAKYDARAKENALKVMDERIAANKKLVDATIDGLSKLQVEHTNGADKIVEVNKIMVDTLEGRLNRLITLQSKLVTKYTELADEDGTAMLAAQTKRANSAQAINDKVFGFQIAGLSNVRKAYAQTERSQTRMNDAMRILGRAKTTEDFQRAEDLLKQAAGYAEGASSSASQEKNSRVLLYKTREQELRIADALYAVDQKRVVTLAQDSKIAKAKVAEETEKLNKMKEYVKLILEANRLSTGSGEARRLKTGDEIAKDAKIGEDAWDKLIKMMTTANPRDIGVADMLGLTTLRQQLDAASKNLPSLKTQVTFDYKTQLQTLAADGEHVRERLGRPFMIKFGIDPTDPFPGLMKVAQQIQDEITQLKPLIAARQANIDSLQELVKVRVWANSQLGKAIETEQGKIKGSPLWAGLSARDLTSAAQAYKDYLTSIQALEKVDPTNIEAFSQALKSVTTARTTLESTKNRYGKFDVGTGFSINPEILKASDDAVTKLKTAMSQVKWGPGAEEFAQLQVLEDRLNQIRQTTGSMFPAIPGELVTNMGTISTSSSNIAISTQNTNTALSTAAPNALIMASAYERMATASQNIRPPIAPAVVAQAKGGYMRFATGGKAQGTDTIPAMLSPGEFVVNARSTRQFYSQLVAMNAGVKPIYRQDGGSVTNIGDINVSVNGSSSTRQTAREIASALRREVRRGTSKL